MLPSLRSDGVGFLSGRGQISEFRAVEGGNLSVIAKSASMILLVRHVTNLSMRIHC